MIEIQFHKNEEGRIFGEFRPGSKNREKELLRGRDASRALFSFEAADQES